MSRILLAAALLGLATAASADGPGSRLRIGPGIPQHPTPAAERDLQRCEALRTEQKERCLKDLRAAIAADEKTRGPESIGGGSGAGSGATSGTSGVGSAGATAPR